MSSRKLVKSFSVRVSLENFRVFMERLRDDVPEIGVWAFSKDEHLYFHYEPKRGKNFTDNTPPKQGSWEIFSRPNQNCAGINAYEEIPGKTKVRFYDGYMPWSFNDKKPIGLAFEAFCQWIEDEARKAGLLIELQSGDLGIIRSSEFIPGDIFPEAIISHIQAHCRPFGVFQFSGSELAIERIESQDTTVQRWKIQPANEAGCGYISAIYQPEYGTKWVIHDEDISKHGPALAELLRRIEQVTENLVNELTSAAPGRRRIEAESESPINDEMRVFEVIDHITHNFVGTTPILLAQFLADYIQDNSLPGFRCFGEIEEYYIILEDARIIGKTESGIITLEMKACFYQFETPDASYPNKIIINADKPVDSRPGVIFSIRPLLIPNQLELLAMCFEPISTEYFQELLKGLLTEIERQGIKQAWTNPQEEGEQALRVWSSMPKRARVQEAGESNNDDLVALIRQAFPKPFTEKRRKRLVELTQFYEASGHYLTQEQIAEQFGVSIDTIQGDLELLKKAGFIKTSVKTSV
jgi:hypothetical protein